MYTDDQIAQAKAAAQQVCLKHIESIRNTDEYKQFVRADILKGFHQKQSQTWSMVLDGCRFLSICCSRRAGKTHLLASLIVLFLLNAKFNQTVVFIAETMKRGKELIWKELCRIIDHYLLDWRKNENMGTVLTKAGAQLRIVGLDNRSMVARIAHGDNCCAILCDESQDYYDLLEDLIVAAGPALAQSRGVFVAAGIPGEAEIGYWHSITVEGAAGFQAIHWTLRDNPHLGRDADEIIREEMERNGWDEDHPDKVRQYDGLWRTDTRKLVCEFDPKLNVVHTLPNYDPTTWRHWVGIDYGFNDASAWVTLASPPYSKDLYVVSSRKESGLIDDEIASITKEHLNPKPVRMVGDAAAKTIIQSWNMKYGRMFGVGIKPANKTDKRGSVKSLNTELRTGRLKLLTGGNDCGLAGADSLIEEMLTLRKGDEADSDPVAPGQEDHAFDALRYILNECYVYLTQPKQREKTEEDYERERIERRNAAARGELDW